MSKYHDEDWKNLPEDVQEAGELIRFFSRREIYFLHDANCDHAIN
jgi:hypothetical protein